MPIVADIHFKPEAALEAARWVEMVRINPGNYADSKKFAVKEYSDEQYAAELARIEEKFTPLVKLCKELGRAMRIGANHGSLSDRIMNRFGDSPLGMVESALEFARIARQHDFHNFKFSMKSSNPKVMIECYRLLAARLEQEGPDWNYPIHLGVTEAGEGEDGRIKSAIGIGSLLVRRPRRHHPRFPDGRFPPRDRGLPRSAGANPLADLPTSDFGLRTSDFPFDPFTYTRRRTPEIELADGLTQRAAGYTTPAGWLSSPSPLPKGRGSGRGVPSCSLSCGPLSKCGGEQTVRVVVTRATWDKLAPKLSPKADVKPEAVYEDLNVLEIDPTRDLEADGDTQLVTVKDGVELPAIAAFRLLAAKLKQMGRNNPILLKDCLSFEPTPLEPRIALLRASVVIGSLLADGIGDAILVRGESGAGQSLRLAYNILQAAGCRSFKTDYVACPSCGRTLFHLQTVTARIKARTEHLKGVKIAIMGCIVNGPGEMADADFGYVGGAPGKINLYVGKTPIKFNIPEAEAVDRLVDLIKEHGKWTEPEAS